MNEFISSVQKLGESNYPVWKFRMELVLIQEGLQAIVTDPKPDDADDTWTEKDAKARMFIGLSLEDSQLTHVIRAATAKDMWDNLKKYHERSSLSSKVHVLRKLCSQRLPEGGSMSDHLNEVTALTNRLAAMGEELKEHLVVAMLFSSLPESYGGLVTALEARQEEDLTLEFVKGKLLDEWRRREERQAAERVLRTSGESTRPSSARSKVTCHYCNKEGHYRRDCKKLAKDSKSADQKPKQKVKMATTDETCLAADTGDSAGGLWVLDSGATSHMTNDKALLETLDTSRQESITVADGKRIRANGIGEGIFQGVNGEGNPMNIKLTQVYHVPALAGNLLSVSKITDQGFSVLFDKKSCKILKNGEPHILGERRGNLYHLKKRSEKTMLTTESHPKQCVHLWHRRLGHRSIDAIKKVVREGLCSGITMQDCGVQTMCGTCYEGKMARLSFPKASESRSKAVGDLIHSDLAGPFEVNTPGGNRYSMVLVDDFSRYTVLYLLRCKSEVYEKIQQYVSLIQNQFNRKPKIFRTDGGGEYSSDKLKKYFADNGILLQQTAPYSPQQNGTAERKNRSLAEMMRCLLTEANLAKMFWGEAISTANYLQNILPTTAASVTPYELWHGRKPSYTHLRVFGSSAWVYIPSQKRKKLDRKAEKLVLVGYAEGRKAYRLLNPETSSITISRDVKFDESIKTTINMNLENEWNEVKLHIKLNGPQIEIDADDNDEEDSDDAASEASERSFQGFPEQQADVDRINEADAEFVPSPDDGVPEVAPSGDYMETPRRSQRPNKGIPPRRLFLCTGNDGLIEPKTFSEAMASPECDKWRSAMQEELQSIEDNETWDLVNLPPGRKPVGSKWVFKIKRGADSEVTRFKARLVAQGYSQQYGTDYDQVFAPVVRQTTFRTLLAVAAKQGMMVRQYDVKTAFLYGSLEEEIYLRQPPGFTVRGHENKVYRLKKSLYGLKQAARAWNHMLHTELLRLGFQRCDSDPCLYRKKEGNQWCYILVYVDDLIIASCNERTIESTVKGLQKRFNISSMGDVHWYLGIEVERDENGDFFLNQKRYIDEISRTNGLEEAKSSKIPIDTGYFKQEDEELLPDNKNYQKLIGQLLYVSVNTRPDISAAVSILSRKTSCPTQNDWNELKRVARYLKGTKDYKLRVSNNAKSEGLVGFSDADWAECRDDRKSNTGFVMMFNGGTISWACRKQTCVSLSTAEAEFVALSEATQELIWLKRLLTDFNEQLNKPTIYEDNQSALKMLESEKFSNRTKHIATRFQFARDVQEKGEVQFVYCPTEEMAADLLTKPIGGVRMAKLRAMCGLQAPC